MIRQIWVKQTMAGLTTKRRSFTLTELLVTIAIIAILMGIAWGAIGRVREQGRVAKTKSTISKINQIVMSQYDSYRTRRVPIDTRGLPPPIAARFRLWAIRCIMAWEMPDRLSDVVHPANDPNNPVAADENLPITLQLTLPNGQLVTRTLRRTSLARRYFRRFVQAMPTGEQSPAELLYLIVTEGTPGSRELFADNEIADTDGDGYLEFIDGWGRPIYFIRCPVAFPDSDIQLPPNASADLKAEDHDPFDPLRVDPVAWRVVPLIYSAGPDGLFGLDLQGQLGYFANWDQWYSTLVGAPVAASHDEFNTHLDNIHNHRAETMP